VVPTVTFRVLYVFVVLAHERRCLLHFNVTSHPSSEWAAQQMVEALPWGNVPRYLLRDRDAIYGESFRTRVRGMGVREVLTAPQSPWQNPYAERLIGSIRRECLDHVIVFNESSLRLLKSCPSSCLSALLSRELRNLRVVKVLPAAGLQAI